MPVPRMGTPNPEVFVVDDDDDDGNDEDDEDGDDEETLDSDEDVSKVWLGVSGSSLGQKRHCDKQDDSEQDDSTWSYSMLPSHKRSKSGDTLVQGQADFIILSD
jgi:hypothetical protein